MRANEFITETLNKETLNPKFKHSIEDNGITYTAKYIKYGGDGKSYFTITATQEIDNQTVRAGEVMFRPKTDGKNNYWLESYMTWVKPDYRKLGLTRMMYAYAKMLGNDIKPSHDQTPRGKAMWQSWKDSGDAEHLLKEYKQYPTTEFEGVSFTMVEEDGYLTVKALNDFGISMASVIFSMDDKELDPQALRVDEKYRGQGIARVMYDYVKSRGFIINRSYDQTDDGKHFWDKHRGEDVRVWEDVPQPGPSSGAPKQFGPDAKILSRQMTVKQIISSIPSVPYYNNVVDDWDAKDYSWGVTTKVIEYATYLKDHPESLAKLPPIIVLNGKFEDGAHRVSAIWLLQQRMDPKNPLWANAKLNVQLVSQD